MMDRELSETLRRVKQLLESRGIRYAIIGGIAATVRSPVRVTEDVDVVMGCELEDAQSILEDLTSGGPDSERFEPAFDGVEDLIRTAFLLPIVDRQSGIRADICVGLTAFERQAVERATAEVLGGITIPVITGEDLLVMKLLADRPKDQQDIGGIVETADETFDWDHCRRLTEEFDREAGLNLTERLDGLRASV